LAGLFFLLVLLLLYFGINTYLFNHDFIIPLVSPVILPAGIFLGCFVCHFFSTERRKSNLKNAEEPMSPGVKKNITVLYFNLENFATFSEINEPDKVMDFLNEYFSFVRRVTEKSGGFCSRYAGCGVLAFFEISENSSSQPQLVVQAALEINKAIRKMADFSFKIETGINTGEVIVGQVGGAGPINQIAVGVEVDLAIHLGSLNRIYGTQILISESPEKFLHHEYSLVTRELDEVRIKGYQNTFKIFELLDKKSLLAAGIDLGFLAYFENGLEAYRQKNWEKAEIQFLMTLNEKPDDGPALLFIKRCRKLKNSSDLSDSWDGVSSYQNG
jgi:adenylate cyclase